MLRADNNFTIGTMTRAAMVFNHRLRLHLAPKHSVTAWKDSLHAPHGSALDPEHTATEANTETPSR
jgi:hypothetical protein